jgi:hypothetical protein
MFNIVFDSQDEWQNLSHVGCIGTSTQIFKDRLLELTRHFNDSFAEGFELLLPPFFSAGHILIEFFLRVQKQALNLFYHYL